MNVKTKLVMIFKTASEKQFTLSIEDPKDSLTEKEIKDAMDLIVAQNIFSPNGSSLVASVEAKVVRTNTTGYDLAI